MVRHTEQAAQMAVVRWLRIGHPEVLFTSPAAAGERLNIRKAARCKAMGYTRGTPDLTIYEPRHGFHGLCVEMKSEKGTTTPHQKEFISGLIERGYQAVVCHSFMDAIDEIQAYLRSK